jgi:hypothetical protein
MMNPLSSEAGAFRALLYFVAVVAVIIICVVVIRAVS